MAEGIKIEIVSPERLVLSTVARAITVPGSEGYFTVMADHAPFMTTLRSGFITVTDDAGKSEIFLVHGGFADVSPEGLTILAEDALPYSDFSREELAAKIKEAEEELLRAQTPEDKSFAQELVSGLLNLASEASQINGAHIH